MIITIAAYIGCFFVLAITFKTMHLLGTKLLKEGSYDISKFREELETYGCNS
jgi:hypothetical protein